MRRSSKEYWSRAKTSGPHQASRTRVLPMTRSRNTTRWEVKCESKYILHRSSAGGRLKEGWRVANVCASVQSRRKHRVSRGVEATRWQSLHWTPSHRNEDLYLKLQILMRKVSRMLKVIKVPKYLEWVFECSKKHSEEKTSSKKRSTN